MYRIPARALCITLVWTFLAGATQSASAQIEVPEGFVVDVLLDPIDGTTPILEAIRNPDYGFGVIAASVDNGILTILRISQSSIDVLGTTTGPWNVVLDVKFDPPGGVLSNQLYISMDEGGYRTHLLRMSPEGIFEPVVSAGSPSDQLRFVMAFTTGSGGYTAGAYLYDIDGNDGSRFYHLGSDGFSELHPNLVPPGRTDMDVRGMGFDPSGAYDNRLIMADSDRDSDDITAIYELLPDLSWATLASPVDTFTRFYGTGGLAISPGGTFGQTLYVTEVLDKKIMAVDPDDGTHTEFASGFTIVGGPPTKFSVTVDDTGDSMFVSDNNGIYRIRAGTTEVGPTLVMREPWVEADDVHTGPAGVDSLRLLWNEAILFDNEDVTITNEDAEPVPFSVSGSNSQFMIIAFGEVLLNDKYTITISDSVESAATDAAIDGDNDGFAGGDAVLEMEHRRRADIDNNGNVGAFDLALLLGDWGP